ncbi:uncharacterized protein LOC120042586, partial [Salvelinus namaycush]|uniref:Uncharacterized protein LOC120042586 n=1 Tax=Salvelinus namaycush TaxID=8040 RepID=A0A8U0QIV7_SALNM
FYPRRSDPSKQIKFLVDLLSQAAEWEEQTGEKTLKLVSSVCTYSTFPFLNGDIYRDNSKQSVFLLDLYSQKKPVELKDWSDEESEVRSFLHCLPYISHLSFCPWGSDPSKQIKVLVDLLSQAAEWEEQTGEKTLKLVSSLCTYSTFPFLNGDTSKHSDFLLDLFSYVKDYETQTGRSVLPALQPVYQSASPAVWSIDLRKRKASLLLEVLKLQPEKKPVKLSGWSVEESKVRSFLQCLPYISQLRPNSGILQQLTVVVYEAQDKDLTQWFLEKVGGDLTSCRLDWEVLLSLLQHSTHNITVDLRKNRFLEKNISDLLPFLGRVTLKSPSKALLLQLLDLVCEGIEEGLLRHTESLCRALDGELDLSETRLDQKVCGSLALVLEHSEGLSKLDLSHCQLTDHHLQPLITHLHKVQVLDLSHNYITDALTDRILQLVSTNTSIHTVRLFNNRIMNRTAFLTEERFEI